MNFYVPPWLDMNPVKMKEDQRRSLREENQRDVALQQQANESAQRMALGYATLKASQDRNKELQDIRQQTAAQALQWHMSQIQALNQRHAADIDMRDKTINALTQRATDALAQKDRSVEAANKRAADALEEKAAKDFAPGEELETKSQDGETYQFRGGKWYHVPKQVGDRGPTATVTLPDTSRISGHILDPNFATRVGTNAPSLFPQPQSPAGAPAPDQSGSALSVGPFGSPQTLSPNTLYDLGSGKPMTGSTGATEPAKRIRVTGPNGEKGTVPEGTDLPDGWKLAD